MLNPSFVARYLASGQETVLCTRLRVKPPKLDIMFAYDCTGSMTDNIQAAKDQTAALMDKLSTLGIDIQYGVISYMDYPHEYDSYGYHAVYGYEGDYPYKLEQPITSDKATVLAKINALTLGHGADGPQDYTRIFYESYTDENIGWRTDAKKILINFADNVPHDNNLNEGVPGKVDVWSTGGDPGRDEIMFTADDLDLQTVLAAMKTNKVTLLEAHAGGQYLEYWAYWTGITGGQVFEIESDSFAQDVYDALVQELFGVTNLKIVVDPSAFESWIVYIQPESYTGLIMDELLFRVRIKVPVDTLEGLYKFNLIALEQGKLVDENLGIETVEINVINYRVGTSLNKQAIEPIYYENPCECGKTCIYPAKWLSGKLATDNPLAQGFYETLVSVTNILPIKINIQYALSIPAQDGLSALLTKWQEYTIAAYKTYQITEDVIKMLLVGTPYEKLFVNGTLLVKSIECCLGVEDITTFYQTNWITDCACTDC